MNISKRFFAILASLTLSAAAHANLIVNGSFEDISLSDGSYITASSISGWTVGSNGIELRNDLYGVAENGVVFAEMDTDGNSSISQTVSTVVGQSYELTFYYSARAWYSGSTTGITFTLDNGGVLSGTTYYGDGSSGSVSWIQYTVDFVATSSSTTVEFAAAGTSDSIGGTIDNVSLLAVPEPSSIAMLLAGLGLIGFTARSKRT